MAFRGLQEPASVLMFQLRGREYRKRRIRIPGATPRTIARPALAAKTLGVCLSGFAAALIFGCAQHQVPHQSSIDGGTSGYDASIGAWVSYPHPIDSPERLTSARIAQLFGSAMELYMERGALPESLDTVAAHARGSTALGFGRELTIDAWGHEIRYSAKGVLVELRSAGADGKFGTKDDLAVATNARQ